MGDLRYHAFLLTAITPTDHAPIVILCETRQRARAAADIAMRARWIAEDERVRWNVACHHRACAY
jgi:hypothetical protein